MFVGSLSGYEKRLAVIDFSDPGALAQEYANAKTFRERHLCKVRLIEKRAVGNWFRDNQSDPSTVAIPENILFSYRSLMLPELVFSDPVARVSTLRPSKWQTIADSIETALNHWVKLSGFSESVVASVDDALLAYGVMKVGLEPDPTSKGQSLRPFVEHRQREDFLIDPAARRWQLAEWLGDEYKRDAQSLLGDPHIDEAARPRLAKMVDFKSGQVRAFATADIPLRGEVTCLDIWVRRPNVILTLAMAGDSPDSAFFLRKPVAYHGSPAGPYEVVGFYRVSNDPYPMSAAQASMEQTEEVLAHMRAAANEAAAAKTVTLVDAAGTATRKALVDGQNGGVFPVEDLQKYPPVTVHIGGMDPGRAQYLADGLTRIYRTLGFSDAQRGQVNPQTATQASIVQNNMDSRTEWMRAQVRSSVKSVMEKVAWYLLNEPAIAMPVVVNDPQTGQPTEGLYRGGPQSGMDVFGQMHSAQEEQELSVHDFELSIEVNSMQHSDDMQQQTRMLQLMQLTTQVSQAMAAMPQINWRYLYDAVGETMNIKNLSELMFPQGMAAPPPPQMAPGMAAMAGQSPGMPPQLPPGAGAQYPQVAGASIPPVTAGVPGVNVSPGLRDRVPLRMTG